MRKIKQKEKRKQDEAKRRNKEEATMKTEHRTWLDNAHGGGGASEQRATRVRHGDVPQYAVDRPEERMCLAVAAVPEVVEVEGPDHAAAQTHLLDPLGLEKRHGHGLVGEGLVRIY